MPLIGMAKALYRRWRRRSQEDADLDEEVRDYFDTLVERFEAQGLTSLEARRTARLHFEGPEQVKQRVRETRMGARFETTLQDLHYAWRSLRNNPGFTTVAVLTLAVGIGANSAIFSLINAVMLRALPVEAPDRLALLTDPSGSGVDMDTTQGGLRTMLSYPEFQELRVRNAREHHPGERLNPRFYANLAHPIGAVDGVTFLLSTSGDPGAVAPDARRAIRQVAPALPVLRLEAVTEALDRRLTTAHLLARLATFFGIVAVFMATVGLSGVISYSIARRTSEIGIRMALGASRLDVLRMVLSEALVMVALGLAIGLPCALAFGRFVATRLFGLKPSDPASIASATAVILVVALLGAYIPARRASRIDPVISLRQE